MPFKNRIRLPIQCLRPQFPEERTRFRKANGVSKTISVVIRKVLEGVTDWMPEKLHERLIIALSHDDVNIEGDKYLTGISLEGAYQIDWQSFLDFPTAPAKFSVEVTPFDASNSNCQTCEEATQLNLVDDEMTGVYGSLEEGLEYTMNVSGNDLIACFPSVFSITLYNTTYLTDCDIDQLGNITVTLGVDLPQANNILLATYRVTCPNGSYDEANVYGDINGTEFGCLAPLNVAVSGITPSSAIITWDDPDPAPSNGYVWELFRVDSPGSPVQSDTSPGPSVALIDLDTGVAYTFYIHGDCGVYDISNNVDIEFTTDLAGDSCGQYEVTYEMQPSGNPAYVTINYTGCDGDPAVDYIILPNLTKLICAFQSAPGEPLNIITDRPTRVTIEYLGLC